MTTQPRPTAEEIAALWPKHGIGICTRALALAGAETPGEKPAACCAWGIVAWDAGLLREMRGYWDTGLYSWLYPSDWVIGLQRGFDGDRADISDIASSEYREGYATGRAVRALVGLEAGA